MLLRILLIAIFSILPYLPTRAHALERHEVKFVAQRFYHRLFETEKTKPASQIFLRGIKNLKDGNYPLAIQNFSEAEQKGSLSAIIMLGSMHHAGLGTPVNEEKAMQLYRKAAAKGVKLAQFQICIYKREKQCTETVSWLLQDLEKGIQSDRLLSGFLYLSGFAQEPDPKKALIILEQLAKDNYVPAQCFLGLFYVEGWENEIPPNPTKAQEWTMLAAENSCSFAQYKLAKHFEEKGEKDKAISWYTPVAKWGYSFAQYHLGTLLIDQDRNAAIEWLSKAARQGLQEAKIQLEKMSIFDKEPGKYISPVYEQPISEIKREFIDYSPALFAFFFLDPSWVLSNS